MKIKEKNDLISLLNIGKVLSGKIEKLGIRSAGEFIEQDPFEVFHKMLKKDPGLCRCALSAIVGAKVNIPWHKIHKKASQEFEKRYPNHKWRSKC